MIQSRLKERTCPQCKQRFMQIRHGQQVCSIECTLARAEAKAQKKAEKAAQADRVKTKRQLEEIKTIPQLKKEAQREFNRFIRQRDRAAGRLCISSNRVLCWESGAGHGVDAGHYRSTGAADHLRFNEDNCHAQSVHDNRDKAGNAVQYRINLISRIGIERVEALECNNTPVKWTREGLRQIRDLYRAKANALAKQ